MSARSTAIQAAVAFILGAAASATSVADGIRGTIIDRSTTLEAAPGNSTEFNTPLEAERVPSSVRTRDLNAMRASATTLPTTTASRTDVLSENESGALFDSGSANLKPATRQHLDALAASLQGKRKLRFSVVGHTDSQRLSARTQARYTNNQGLSEARAFEVAQYLRGKLGLPAEAFTIRGAADLEPVADNTTPAGMSRNRRVELQIWYEEEQATASATPTAIADVEGCRPGASSGSPAPLRMTLDGEPLNANDTVSEADRQRCVDVSINRHDIQIQFDPLATEPALNVTAWPDAVAPGEPVELIPYSNYLHWIAKAEIRFFAPGQDPREHPFLVLPLKMGTALNWTPDRNVPDDSRYVLRVYDSKGRFDETRVKSLRILDHAIDRESATTTGRLAGYGESSLRIRNIPLNGGSVTVSGKNMADGERVIALGAEVPVDAHGRFVTRQLLPSGTHTVNVITTPIFGERTTYTRNLTIDRDTWFYVALGELTASKNDTSGPAQLVTQDDERYEHETEVTGRGAFYVKGKVRDDYLVTLSADTRERPVEDLFSNFTSKDPRYLLQRIDSERAYPVYGDDSTSEWDAPTNGRFYARVERKDSRAVWGNFQTAWTGLELNQFSRGLYGADLLLKTEGSTSFGERRATSDMFAAEPGTLSSREEFRGTGGSLYYLHRQDITRGSERLWVEVRDQTSGVTLQRTQLVPGQDYEVSYLQGRVLLRAPLSSVADSSALVQLGSLSGNPLYLVATYEYSPSLNEADSNVYGVRQSAWLNDYVRLGLSGYRQGDSTDRQTLGGLDATLRYAPATYLDIEAARSDGAASQLSSIDGGFGFGQSLTPDGRADAKRVQGVFDLSEVFGSARGRGSAYWQQREAGFSGPGALVPTDAIEQKGAAFSLPLGMRTSVDLKADERDGRVDQIAAEAAAVHVQLDPKWAVSVGARHDDRENDLPNASTLLSQNGERTDAVVRIDFKPLSAATGDSASPSTARATASAPSPTATALNGSSSRTLSNLHDITGTTLAADAAAEVAARPASWQAYTYGQGTVNRTGNRNENNRGGVGFEHQLSERFRLGGEASGGNGGFGGKLTGDYRLDERTNLYLGHTIETEREDSTYPGRAADTVIGGRTKLSDQVSLYDEARSARGAGPDSLTNAFGVDLAPNERWTYGLKFEAGTVSDPLAGDLRRRAAGLAAGYKLDDVKASSSVEYRHEAGISGERDTWLARNLLGYQVNPDWRLLAKANFSFSKASAGNFFDGNFVDASLGGAYRPVANDRWNLLMQYRYYYTLPSPGQVGAGDELLDYAQRSHVVSIDGIYDLVPWLSLGGKYARRTGEIRDTRAGGDWYSSAVDLFVVRWDLHLVREWDLMLEGRRLAVHEADDARSGALAAVYRHLGKHVKLGVGYNFTDFSDDLTDLSYRSRGPFLNVLSTF